MLSHFDSAQCDVILSGVEGWFLKMETRDMEVNVLNRYKMLMMLSAVLMASSLMLIITNFTGAMEYSKKNIAIYAWMFAMGVFFFVKNMRKSEN
jgi:peptidoglycan/LPS O-acetylase OafA/YrhL